jgi:hypothetical protein
VEALPEEHDVAEVVPGPTPATAAGTADTTGSTSQSA